jgi:tetratricopeptide (TPR) repeat protein
MKLILGTILCLCSFALCAEELTGTNAQTAATEAGNTNAVEEAEVPAQMPLPPKRVAPSNGPAKPTLQEAALEQQLEMAREERLAGNYDLATPTLLTILQAPAGPALHRRALLEMAAVAYDSKQWIKTQQIFAQYIHLYPDDPNIPDLLLKQGLLYRKMGVNVLAEAKFYAVMSSALKLKLDNPIPAQPGDIVQTNSMDYYKKLVLQAQIEIAETYYEEGKYRDSADFYSRILRSDTGEASPEELHLKQIRSLSNLTNYTETIASAQVFLDRYTNSVNTPEIRFLLASALKDIGRTHESMKQVLLLLQSQQENMRKDPETWAYWQRRAGNEIANQFYKNGNYMESLQIYQSLAVLDKSAAWQVPVSYQIGLVYEQLKQWKKASDAYGEILNRQKEFPAGSVPMALSSLFDMAKWRQDYIAWLQKASAENLVLAQSLPPQSPTTSETSNVTK